MNHPSSGRIKVGSLFFFHRSGKGATARESKAEIERGENEAKNKTPPREERRRINSRARPRGIRYTVKIQSSRARKGESLLSQSAGASIKNWPHFSAV